MEMVNFKRLKLWCIIIPDGQRGVEHMPSLIQIHIHNAHPYLNKFIIRSCCYGYLSFLFPFQLDFKMKLTEEKLD